MWQGDVKDQEFVNGGYKAKQFFAELQIDDMYSGRSAKGFIARDIKTNKTYTFFIRDFLDMMKKTKIKQGGLVSGMWGWKKRGQSFGIYYIGHVVKILEPVK
jgi:hypothetical protein